MKFNEVEVDANTARVFSLDPSVSAVDGTYVYKYNFKINCNYNSVSGELGDESALVFTDNNKLNAKFNYWGSRNSDPDRFVYGSGAFQAYRFQRIFRLERSAGRGHRKP